MEHGIKGERRKRYEELSNEIGKVKKRKENEKRNIRNESNYVFV